MTSTIRTVYYGDFGKYIYRSWRHLFLPLAEILSTYFHPSYFAPLIILIRMSSHDNILGPPALNLFTHLNNRASPELRQILDCTYLSMAHQFRQELFSKAPTEHDECIRAVDIWITRLEMIRSGLANFPVLKSECETSTVAQSPAMTPSVYGNPTYQRATQVPQVGPSQASVTECLERDQYQCIITRRKLSKGFATEVVPIIPFAFANHPGCRDLDFWKMLELFYGSEATDTMFSRLLDKVDSLENLVTLDNSIHAKFNSGSFTLGPQTETRGEIPVINDYRGGYWLEIRYTQTPYLPEDFLWIEGPSAGEIRQVYPWARIAIAYHEGMPDYASVLPLPSYFALRAFILSLKDLCIVKRSKAPLSDISSLTPSPLSSVDSENQYSTQKATSESPSADPVLAASAILQALVDAGALGRSP